MIASTGTAITRLSPGSGFGGLRLHGESSSAEGSRSLQDIEEKGGRRAGNDSRPLQDHFTDFERAQSLACKADTPGDRTAVDTRRWLDRLPDRCGRKLLADIHADDIEAYASELRETGRPENGRDAARCRIARTPTFLA